MPKAVSVLLWNVQIYSHENTGSLNTSMQYKMISAYDDQTVSENWRYVTTLYLSQGPPNKIKAFKSRLKLIFSRLNKTSVLFWQKFPLLRSLAVLRLICLIQADLDVLNTFVVTSSTRDKHKKIRCKTDFSSLRNLKLSVEWPHELLL